jgi:hypothetical protein
MPAELFAIDVPDTSKAAQYLLRGLAVGGAFLVGYVLTWVVARLLDRSLTAGKSPSAVHKSARFLGGLLLAVIAAIFLFGPGGDGLGFGGGPGEGKGQGAGEGKGGEATKPTQPISADVKSPEPTKSDPVPPEQRVRVTMLGGEDVKDERFYLLDDDRSPRTFAEVTAAVTAKKSASAKPVGVEVRFTATNTLPRTHPAVLRLTNWAQANGVSVSFPAQP